MSDLPLPTALTSDYAYIGSGTVNGLTNLFFLNSSGELLAYYYSDSWQFVNISEQAKAPTLLTLPPSQNGSRVVSVNDLCNVFCLTPQTQNGDLLNFYYNGSTWEYHKLSGDATPPLAAILDAVSVNDATNIILADILGKTYSCYFTPPSGWVMSTIGQLFAEEKTV